MPLLPHPWKAAFWIACGLGAGSLLLPAAPALATERQADRLLASAGTTLKLAQGGRAGGEQAPLGRLPASWRGDLVADGGSTRWQVDLAPDGTFQLRHTRLGRGGAERGKSKGSGQGSHDDIGRWRLESGGQRLVLQGSREALVLLQPLEQGQALRKLSPDGQPLASGSSDLLRRLAVPEPLEPRLPLQGLFRYMADAASIRLCATGTQLPVAMEGDYLALERAYLAARPADAPGLPLLVNLEGLIGNRPSAEPGLGPVRTLVVERFVAVQPGQSCPAQPPSSPTGNRTQPTLQGQSWRLQALQDSKGPALPKTTDQTPELELAADSDRLSGSGGCNRLMGGYQLQGQRLRFSQLASTQMACPEAAMAFEQRYTRALERVRRWSIDGNSLLLQDKRGRTLLVFQPTM